MFPNNCGEIIKYSFSSGTCSSNTFFLQKPTVQINDCDAALGEGPSCHLPLLPPPPTREETFRVPQNTIEAREFCRFMGKEL